MGDESKKESSKKELDPFIDRDKILYSTPSHLLSKVEAPKQHGTAGNYATIEEVSLPEEFRDKNITDTKEARKKLQSKPKSSGEPEEINTLHQHFLKDYEPSKSDHV